MGRLLAALAPALGQRHQVKAVPAVGAAHRHLGDQPLAARGGQIGPAQQLGRVQPHILVGEPAAVQQIGRQHLMLEQPSTRPRQQAGIAVAHDDGHQFRSRPRQVHVPGRRLGLGRQQEPIEPVTRQGEEIGQLADGGKGRLAGQFHRHPPAKGAQVQFHPLGRARQVAHAQHGFVLGRAQEGQDLAVAGVKEPERAAPEAFAPAPHRDHALHPVEQAGGRAQLRLHVHRLEAVDRVLDRRQVQAGGVGAGKAAVAVLAPLHGGAHAVAIAQKDVVAHADLVAVIDDRRARHGKQQRIEQLDLAAVVFHQRREAPADAQVDAGAAVGGIGGPQIVTLAVGDHFQRQLVMVAQEDGPLAGVGNVRRLAHDVGDGVPVLARDGHVHARHQGEVERHVAFVALAEIGQHIFGPLVGLSQEHAAGMGMVQGGAQFLQDAVGLGQVLVVGTLALAQVWHGVQPHAVHPHVQPEPHDRDDLAHHPGIVEIQVGLVAEEAVPIELLRLLVPGPVGFLGVGEDDAGAAIAGVVVAPDVIIARHRAGRGQARPLEPRMLVRSVVDHQFGDHLQAAFVRGADEGAEVAQGTV